MVFSDLLFLFLFLPLSLLLLPLCPARYRRLVMLFLSLSFYVLANLYSPWCFVQIAFVVALMCLLTCIPGDTLPRFRLALGVGFPLALFIASRVCAEVIPQYYDYPFGLGMITLGAISLAIDHYRNDAPETDSPLSVVSYLLFFPTITLGPVLRYKQYLYLTERATLSLSTFSYGATLYMLGYLKRIAVSTLLFATLNNILPGMQDGLLPVPALLLALFLSFFALYFTVSGITDMSRGLLCLYGYPPTRGEGRFFSCVMPHRMLYGLIPSLESFFQDYVAQPLGRVLPPKWSRRLCAVAVLLLTLLFYRSHPAILLVALPLFLSAFFGSVPGRYAKRPRRKLLRLPLSLLCAVFLSVLVLAMMLENPFEIFRLLSSLWRTTDQRSLSHILVSLFYLNHLWLMFLILAIGMPLTHFLPLLLKNRSARLRKTVHLCYVLFVSAGFLLTIIYLLPQFPQYVGLSYCEILY